MGVLLVSNGELVDSDGVERLRYWHGGDDDAGNTSALNAGEDRCPDTDNCVDGQREPSRASKQMLVKELQWHQKKLKDPHSAVKKIEAKQG